LGHTWVKDAHAGVVFGVPTHTPAQTRRHARTQTCVRAHSRTHTRARAHTHAHIRARTRVRACVRVCVRVTHAQACTGTLTPHTHASARTPHAHEPWACVCTRSGFPHCHDCRSPEVSSEPSNPRKRNRRQGDGIQTLNGYRLQLTLPVLTIRQLAHIC
jgi:hypothetical protein